jgi:hypothetical protein
VNSKRAEIGDDRNASFELSDSRLEDLKPGIVYGGEKRESTAEGQHRFPRRDKKDIPQESLRARIGKALKEG